MSVSKERGWSGSGRGHAVRAWHSGFSQTARFKPGLYANLTCDRGAVLAGTRKLAAILAADVVGYCRLAGADADRTLARLRALRGE